MESAWATSRFFREANNAFGMWSFNKNEPRIYGASRGKQIIWIRKFKNIEDGVRSYYKLMGVSGVFKEFRKVRSKTNNVYTIIKKLDKYSEIGHRYTRELKSIIKYNKLTKYDEYKE